MRVIEARNAEAALRAGLQLLTEHGTLAASRNGDVIVAPWPVMTVTERPTERVVLAPWRDANPFFHLVEAAWMLAGRDDAAFLTPYVRRFADYAEPSTGRVHGAYGARWRSALGIDQLNVVVRRLRESRDDRQCVLQMWDCSQLTANHGDHGTVTDYLGHEDLAGPWRDRPCNTHCYLRVRPMQESDWRGHAHYLDLTVCCRSNDMLWGAHGANAVHFSCLQEYLADRIGVGVGRMYQLSNNYHAYLSTWKEVHQRLRETGDADAQRYQRGTVAARPMRLPDEPALDPVLPYVCTLLEHVHAGEVVPPVDHVQVAFGRLVLLAAMAHAQHRAGRTSIAISIAETMEATDWRAACVEWLQRRAARREAA